MKHRVYEGMFLIDSNRAASDLKAAIGEIEEMLKREEAEILMCRKWDERRLAYDIRGHRKGTYVVSYFRVAGDRIAEIERRCRLAPMVLRTLILQVPEKQLDNLMAKVEAPRPVEAWDRDRRSGPPRSGDRAPQRAPVAQTAPVAAPPVDAPADAPVPEPKPAEADEPVTPDTPPAEPGPDAAQGETT